MIKLFFGSPGCGKSTLVAYFAYKYKQEALKRAMKGKKGTYKYIFCNYEVANTSLFNRKDLDTKVFPSGSLALIDEAGIDFNSRKTLKLTDASITYFKKHRHYTNDIFLFSQSWEDVDCILTRLCNEVWHCKKIGPWTLCRRILKVADVNPDTRKIEDCYKKEKLYKKFLPYPLGSFSFFVIYRPKYYHLFSSWECEEKPIIQGEPLIGNG